MARLLEGSVIIKNGIEKLVATVEDVNAVEDKLDSVTGGTAHAHDNLTVLNKFGEAGGVPTYSGNAIGGSGGTSGVVTDYTFNAERSNSSSPFSSSNLPTGWTITTSGSSLTIAHGQGKLAARVGIICYDVPTNGEVPLYQGNYATNYRVVNVYSGANYNSIRLENLTANKYQIVVGLVAKGF